MIIKEIINIPNRFSVEIVVTTVVLELSRGLQIFEKFQKGELLLSKVKVDLVVAIKFPFVSLCHCTFNIT